MSKLLWRIPALLTVAALLGSAAIAAGQDPITTTASGPRLELDASEFDFGEVWENTKAEKVFTVRNVGDLPLTISVRSSCGCTVATKPKSPLDPGEKSEFTISYSTNRTGKARKTVTLTTNDPDQPQVRIPVRGEVKPLFAISPGKHLTFTGLSEDSADEEVVKLENQYGKPVELKLAEGQKFDRFQIKLDTVEPGQKYELTAATVPPLNTGTNRASVRLVTNLEDVPEIVLPVTAIVRPRVSVSPSRMVLRNSPRDIEKRLWVHFREDDPIKITQVTANFDGVETQIMPPAKPFAGRSIARHEIRLKLPPFDQVPGQNAKIVVHTDDQSEQYSTIEVPVIKRTSTHVRRPMGSPHRTRPQAKPPADPDELRKKIEEAMRRAQAQEQDEAGEGDRPASPE